ncbi:MAG: regulator of protease activity HflC (stomatin/prohibitin superfamily), partial [Parvicellaceae bacterium]
MTNEKEIKGVPGIVMFLLSLILIGGGITAIAVTKNPAFAASIVLGVVLLPGLFIVSPNSSRVLVLFGKYTGTVKNNGWFWVNPFYTKQKISLRARNFDSERVKVNDKLGNPIMISVILVWKVKDTHAAAFDVDNYEHFVRVQTDAAVRKLAGMYNYDNFDDPSEVSLRSGMEEVNLALEREVEERLTIAGIDVHEARIGYLAYAQEIASAM